MGQLRWILWQALITPGMERLIAGASTSGFEFSGLILQAQQDAPFVVRYRIEVDAGWRTQYGVNWKAVATSGALA